MVYFLAGLAVLAAGYFAWGHLAERAVRPDPDRRPPALACTDGVDCVPMPTWRVFLIQLLNIAGLGPIFGPIMGALWGPQVFLWIVFGAVLGGAVHDFLSGVMSVRNRGAGISALIGHYLGEPARHAATFFILLLMLLVGTVFVKAPAGLLAQMLPADTVAGWLGIPAAESHGWHQAWLWLWMVVIYAYYMLATLLPVDKIIGRVYPLFALALLVMVVGIAGYIVFGHLAVPQFTLQNLHPKGTVAWPIIFITVSCGAVSGFHSTQSPIMARCIRSERYMRPVFYGAMIAEGFIALIWACAAQGWYGSTENLLAALSPENGGVSGVVHTICTGTMGTVGGILAILGVVVLPITSGDTAFRVARLIAAEYLGLDQKPVRNRYVIALPVFGLSLVLQFIDFKVIWQYFGWANQTLAAVVLWTGAVFLARRGRWWWMAAAPALFMTVMTVSYLMIAPVGLGMSQAAGTMVGSVAGLAALGVFLAALPRLKPESDDEPQELAGPTEAERQAEGVAE
ncbi:MAG: carbon starvation protein A [Deltaproteobacteria bacterium]|nr:MAG: carbon starvation protein A [Deltaproteobacteria bacterium]